MYVMLEIVLKVTILQYSGAVYVSANVIQYYTYLSLSFHLKPYINSIAIIRVSYTIYFHTVIIIIHFIQQNTLRNGVQRNVKYKITYYLYATVAINPGLLISSVHTNFNIHAIDF